MCTSLVLTLGLQRACIPTDLVSPRIQVIVPTERATVQVHSGHSPFVSCGFKGVTVFELLCDGQFLFPPVSGEACVASVDEIVPMYRRATTLRSGSPHGDSVSMCINEAARSQKAVPKKRLDLAEQS